MTPAEIKKIDAEIEKYEHSHKRELTEAEAQQAEARILSQYENSIENLVDKSRAQRMNLREFSQRLTRIMATAENQRGRLINRIKSAVESWADKAKSWFDGVADKIKDVCQDVASFVAGLKNSGNPTVAALTVALEDAVEVVGGIIDGVLMSAIGNDVENCIKDGTAFAGYV